MLSRSTLLVLSVLATAALSLVPKEQRPWMNLDLSPRDRAINLVLEMNVTEKINMLYGVGTPYVGKIQGNDRLDIPAIIMNDGPQGFRAPDKYAGTTSAFPSAMTVAATWDRTSSYLWGKAMGEEFLNKGANVQLGPGLNVARVPLNGRNFEYISGEDPILGANMVAPSIQGIQSTGVIANAKHYVQNNQETNRGSISENVDERTQWEIYYPPFESAVDAGVLSIMCSYNRINSVYACENNQSLTVSLKQRMGFEGWVMSDWGGTHSTVLAANAGLDQQMPDGSFFNQPLLQAVQNGQVSMYTIDDKVVRILTSMFTAGLFDRPTSGSIDANVTSDAHNTVCRTVAARATTLLQNKGALPLKNSALRIVVVGDWALNPTVAGGGSGHVAPPYVISPLQGIQARIHPGSTVKYFSSAQGPEATSAAATADIAIIVTGTSSGEGSDRHSLDLPTGDDALIAAIAAVQPNTIAVVLCPGAVLMPWAHAVNAILVQYMPGQECGNALADILFGEVNPSGRLPITMPNRNNEINFTQAQYPGLPADNPANANYTERLLIGYRWYDANQVAPLFPFGHGLSYTTFEYTSLVLQKAQGFDEVFVASFTLKNTGSIAGAEVYQIYLGFPAAAGEPPRQLKQFDRITLQPQEESRIAYTFTPRDVSIWDIRVHEWVEQTGFFTVQVGASSRDIRLQAEIQL